MKPHAKTAVSVCKSTQPCATVSHGLWEFVNKNWPAASLLEKKAFTRALPIGAALHLLKLQTAEGDWHDTYAANCAVPLRTAQRWMANVTNVLAVVNFPADERTFRVLVEQRADDDFSRTLFEALENAVAGKNGVQLQLGIGCRKPKRLNPAACLKCGAALKHWTDKCPIPTCGHQAKSNDPTDAENAAIILDKALMQYRTGFAQLVSYAKWMTDEQRRQVAWLGREALWFTLPDCALQAVPAGGDGVAIELDAYLTKETGPRP